jgi:hypothetical protein
MKSLIKGYGREKWLGTAGLDSRLTDGCEVVSLMRRPSLNPGRLLVPSSVSCRADPRVMLRPEALG